MLPNVGNWISENCSTSGTGNLILTGAASPDTLSFGKVIPPGLCYYSIRDGDDRESGVGTFDGTNTIIRTTVTSTKVGSNFITNGTPLTLSGNSIVTCTLNAQALISSLYDSVKWKGQWLSGVYEKNDMVRVGGYTMVALRQTEENPEPQEIGGLIPTPGSNVAFSQRGSSAIVTMIHYYDILKDGWLKQLKINSAFWDSNSVTKITMINQTAGVVQVINNPALQSGVWVTVRTDSIIAQAGDIFEVQFEYYNKTGGFEATGKWTSSIATGVPVDQIFTIDSVTNPTVIEISHTDLDSVDRAADLDGIIPGAILEFTEEGDITRSVSAEVVTVDTTSTTSTRYNVTLAQSGAKDIRNNRTCNMKATQQSVNSSLYLYDTTYYTGNHPGWANVTTKILYDAIDSGNPDTEAYGIEVSFPEAGLVDDWQFAVIQ